MVNTKAITKAKTTTNFVGHFLVQDEMVNAANIIRFAKSLLYTTDRAYRETGTTATIGGTLKDIFPPLAIQRFAGATFYAYETSLTILVISRANRLSHW